MSRAAAVVLGAVAIFAARFFLPTGWELIAISAVPVIAVALVSRSLRDTAIWAGYVTAIVSFVFIRGFANRIFAPHTDYVVTWEKWLFQGAVPTVWLQGRYYSSGAVDWFDWGLVGVYVSYFLVPHLLAFLIWMHRPQLLVRCLAAVVVTMYAGLIAQVLVPTAPPWLASMSGHIEPVSRIVEALLSGGTRDLFEHGNRIIRPNDVAAMPSLHTGGTVIAALMLGQFSRTVRWLGAAYALAMAFALVYLAEHYVVDVLAGALLAAAAWRATRCFDTPRAATATPASRPYYY